MIFKNLFKSKKEQLRIRSEKLSIAHHKLIAQCLLQHGKQSDAVPLIRIRNKASLTLSQFKQKRTFLEMQWSEAYNGFSWWNKLQYDENLGLSCLDEQIESLENELNTFNETYKEQFQRLDRHFDAMLIKSIERIDRSFDKLTDLSEKYDFSNIDDGDLFRKASWFAAFSIPISIWDDCYSATNIYDALRSVNGNFLGMSDSEIWWESLFMTSESLTGLCSLAKGAYFEQLVASNTGGQLFEHFNNPGTDIIIDGVEMQIKATNSISYISSVDDDIPVIATSEIADRVGAIDGGYSNEELSNSVELALGGSVVDIQDTAIDAIFTGTGSLGLFATINGIKHAQDQFDNGVDGIEAIFKGAGVAIEGTAKGLVDVSEMAYNVVMSKPSRFVGRLIRNGLVKLDNKMMS